MAPHSGRAINRVKQFNSTLSTLNFYRYRCWLGLFFLFIVWKSVKSPKAMQKGLKAEIGARS